MAALMRNSRVWRKVVKAPSLCCTKTCSTQSNDNHPLGITQVKAVQNVHEELEKLSKSFAKPEQREETFAGLLRKSKFVQMGDFNKTIVIGKVIELVDNDLYIDFGGKFHCVCQRPSRSSMHFSLGDKVKVQLRDYEMTASFVGASQHVTLLEADATLLGHESSRPINTRYRRKRPDEKLGVGFDIGNLISGIRNDIEK